jgi:hypothetical protein
VSGRNQISRNPAAANRRPGRGDRRRAARAISRGRCRAARRARRYERQATSVRAPTATSRSTGRSPLPRKLSRSRGTSVQGRCPLEVPAGDATDTAAGPRCEARLPLTLEECDRVRAQDDRSAIAPGHETREIEHVIERNERFCSWTRSPRPVFHTRRSLRRALHLADRTELPMPPLSLWVAHPVVRRPRCIFGSSSLHRHSVMEPSPPGPNRESDPARAGIQDLPTPTASFRRRAWVAFQRMLDPLARPKRLPVDQRRGPAQSPQDEGLGPPASGRRR